MEMVILVVIGLAVAAYYGFTSSLEKGAKIATDEVEHLADVHQVSIIQRTAKLEAKIDDATVAKASAVKAKIAALREVGEIPAKAGNS